MPTFGVVLDACVLIPASLCDTLLQAAAADLYRLHWSEATQCRYISDEGLLPALRAGHFIAAHDPDGQEGNLFSVPR